MAIRYINMGSAFWAAIRPSAEALKAYSEVRLVNPSKFENSLGNEDIAFDLYTEDARYLIGMNVCKIVSDLAGISFRGTGDGIAVTKSYIKAFDPPKSMETSNGDYLVCLVRNIEGRYWVSKPTLIDDTTTVEFKD